MRFLLFAGLLLLFAAPASAQETDTTSARPDSARVHADLEDAVDDLDRGPGSSEQLADFLADLAAHPLDVNAASAGELDRIPALSPLVARNIVRFRQRYGPYASLHTLRAVEGVTAEVLRRSRPYLSAGEPSSEPSGGEHTRRFPKPPSFRDVFSKMEFTLMQRYTRRLDLGKGYEKSARLSPEGDTVLAAPYLGPPGRLYTRLRGRSHRYVRLALTLEKDPGERFVWEPGTGTYGYDHVGGHVALSDFGRLKTLVAGDFTTEFGQGAILWGGRAFGLGRDAVRTLVRSGGGIEPYGSGGENRFLRGLAGTVRLTPALSASAFASRRMLDATFADPDTTLRALGPGGATRPHAHPARATSLARTGLHRTTNELTKKDALGETLLGGALEYANEALRIGAAGYHARFDDPLAPDTSRLFRRFDFSGDRATAASLYAQVFAGDFLFFGESARAPGGALGGLGGVLLDLPRAAEAVLRVRHFPRNFAGLHSYGTAQNETSFFAGLRLKPHEHWTVSAHFNQFRHPWVRFAVPRPSGGYDARLVAEHQPHRWLSYYVQLRHGTQEDGADLRNAQGRPLDGLIDETRQSARLHLDYAFSDRLRLRSRIEGTRYFEGGPRFENEGFGAAHGTRHGLLLYQDVRWRPFQRLRLDARLAFFDTDGYDARVYAYENDLLYAFSVPAFFGEGQRFYLLARYQPFEALVLEVKYAATRFRNAETIGSGYDEIDGNRRRQLSAQVRLKL